MKYTYKWYTVLTSNCGGEQRLTSADGSKQRSYLDRDLEVEIDVGALTVLEVGVVTLVKVGVLTVVEVGVLTVLEVGVVTVVKIGVVTVV